MTGENFKRFNGGIKSKELKEKIAKIKDTMAMMQNVNYIRENGFDDVEHERLYKLLERYESI